MIVSRYNVQNAGMNFLTSALNVIGYVSQIVISALNVTTGLMMTVNVLSAIRILNTGGAVNLKRPSGRFSCPGGNITFQ